MANQFQTIQQHFETYHAKHPDVYALLVQYARKAKARGRKRREDSEYHLQESEQSMSRKIIDIYEPRTIAVELDASKVRQIHHSIFSTKDAMSTLEAEAFLFLHGDQLLDGLNGYVREFLKEKLA